MVYPRLVVHAVVKNNCALEASLVFCFGGPVGLLRAPLCPFFNHLTMYGLGCQNSRAGPFILIISKLLTVSVARLLRKSVCCRFITLKPRSQSAVDTG